MQRLALVLCLWPLARAVLLAGDEEAEEPSEGKPESPGVWEDSDQEWRPTDWDSARDKAVTLVQWLSDAEIASLLRGKHFNLQEGKPHDGYYIGNTEGVPRFNIPSLKMQDAGSGFRPTEPRQYGSTTSFPSLLALASTWDEYLVEDVAKAMGKEFRQKGANVMLGPDVQVSRSPYGGRNFDFLSGEDPALGARLAGAFVRGVQSQGVMSVLKHFAFNQQETKRMVSDSIVDERTAWSLYYPPFEAGVAAGAGGVMCAYNKVNGTHACENEDLLRRDLRGKMGFKGIVMSDYYANHNKKTLEKGLDMELPGPSDMDLMSLFTDQNLRNVANQTRREAAVRVMTSMFRMRMQEQQGCRLESKGCADRLDKELDREDTAAVAREAATESVILLQNDGVLPIDKKKVKKIVVLGQVANAGRTSGYYTGGGSSDVKPKLVELGNVPMGLVKPVDAIWERAYTDGIEVEEELSGDIQASVKAAQSADVIVVVAGARSSEGQDRKSLALDNHADRLISAVSAVGPTVVLLQTPGAVLTPWRRSVSAVLNMFYGGEATGRAWAAVLFGDKNPSGKLPIMMPLEEEDALKPAEHHLVKYSEGVFTSYRAPKPRAAYPFGHGLSYTSFKYGKPEIVKDCDVKGAELCISMNITNTGLVRGNEVAQVYISFADDLKQPEKVLKAFFKTQDLGPGELDEAFFALTERDLSVYMEGKGWDKPEEFELGFGSSSADIRFVTRLRGKDLHLVLSEDDSSKTDDQIEDLVTKLTAVKHYSRFNGFEVREEITPKQHAVQLKTTQREDWSPFLAGYERMNKAEAETTENRLDDMAEIGKRLAEAAGFNLGASRASQNKGLEEAVKMGAKLFQASQHGDKEATNTLMGFWNKINAR